MRRSPSVLSRLSAAAVSAAELLDEPGNGCSPGKAARLAAHGISVAAWTLDLTPDPYAADTDVLH
jgi:hypothetical protein